MCAMEEDSGLSKQKWQKLKAKKRANIRKTEWKNYHITLINSDKEKIKISPFRCQCLYIYLGLCVCV